VADLVFPPAFLKTTGVVPSEEEQEFNHHAMDVNGERSLC